MNCRCGATLEGDAKFCRECGAPVGGGVGVLRHPKRRRNLLIGGAAALGIVGAAVAAVTAVSSGGDDKPNSGPSKNVADAEPVLTETLALAAAFNACDDDDLTEVMSLADEGRTILVDTRSEYGSTQPVRCLFRELDVPTAFTAQIEATTAMMGVQEFSEGDLTFKWSYHPDNGLNLIITEAGQ